MDANIQKLKDLIAQLELARGKLSASSSEFKNLTSTIERFGATLQKIEQGQVKNFTRSIQNMFAGLEGGAGKVSLAGDRFRTKTIRTAAGITPDVLNPAALAKANEEMRAIPGAAPNIKEEARQLKQAAKELEAATKAAAKAKAEADALFARKNLNLHLAGGQLAANNVQTLASKIDPNFTAATMTGVTTEASTNISRVNYAYQTADGILKKLTVTVDKFGGVLVDTQKRFRSFTSGLIRDIAEVAKWSIAVAVVYAPMQKFSELIQTMIANEAALADISVSLGNAQTSMNDIFTAAADIAQATGESLNGVISAYNLAYRATGGMSSATERFTTANTLLRDAIILAKISTLDQAQSIDVLSAALKQTNTPLDQGITLLDKWVRTTKVANVDLATLAQGFSVVGDAADAAGINTDKLNAVIATIAETSNSSGKEVANTAKAIISGFQSDNAQKELRKLGIAIDDTSGKSRGFINVMQQLYDLRMSGVIGDEAFSRLTLALGGGTRRQAAYSTFIENFGKVSMIEQESMSASGDAAAAMAKEMDTVQAATINLGNAFQELAQSLGESGGMLDVFKVVINLASGVVRAFSDLTAGIGKAAPVLYATAAAMLYLRDASHKAAFASGFSGLVSGAVSSMVTPFTKGKAPIELTTPASWDKNKQIPSGEFMQYSQVVGQRAGNWAAENSKYIASAAIGLVPAIQNAAQGKWDVAGADIAGAIIGTLITKGSPIGAVIGTSAAEALMTAVKNAKFTVAELTVTPLPGTPTGQVTTKTPEELASDAMLKFMGTGSPGLGTINILGQQLANNIGAFFTGKPGETFSDTLLREYSQYGKSGRYGYDKDVNYEQTMGYVTQAREPGKQAQLQIAQFTASYGESLNRAISDATAKLRKDYIDKNISAGAYRTGKENLQALPVAAYQYQQVMGGTFPGGSDNLMRVIAEVAARGNPEDLTEMVRLLGEAVTALNNIGNTAGTAGMGAGNRVAPTDAQNFLLKMKSEIDASTKLLDEVDLSSYSKQAIQQIEDNALLLQDAYYTVQMELGNLTEEQKNAILEAFKVAIVKTAEGYVASPSGLDPKWLSQSASDLKSRGLLQEKQASIGFQEFDMTSAKFEGILARSYQPTLDKLMAQGYTSEETTQVGVFDNGEVKPYTKDWRIVQYLLQQILDTEQKQLDGMFNLPEGASFWVPASAKQLSPGATASGDTSDTTSTLGNQIKTEVSKQVSKKGTAVYDGGMPKELWDQYMNRPFTGSDKLTTTLGTTGAQEALAATGNLITTQLNLTINTTTTLTVDGRILATVIKPYLTQDLVRYAGGGGGSKVMTMRSE